MKKITENKYYEALKRAYFDERMKKTESQFYKDWINSKFQHSIEVTEIGIEILNSTPELNSLDGGIKEEFVSALLTHDLARAKEIDYITGKVTGVDHATLGAIELVESGEVSLNIIIPVMIHSRFDDEFIEVDDEKLKARKDFAKLSDEDKDFTFSMRSKYFALSDEEKRIIKLGVGLVKDADKVANLAHYERLIPLNLEARKPYISQNVIDDLAVRNELMVLFKSVETIADKIVFWMSWVNDLRFGASKDIVVKNNLFQKMKNTILDMFRNEDAEDLKKLSADLDLVIECLNK